MEKTGKILKYFLLTVAVLFFAAFAMIQTSYFQTKLTGYAAAKIGEHFDADVRVGHLSFKPFTTIVVKDLAVIDTAPLFEEASDTLMYIRHLNAKFSLRSLIGAGHEDFILERVRIDGGAFNMVVEGDRYVPTNLARMFHLRRDKVRKEPKQKDIFRIKHLEATGMCYTMRNFKTEEKKRKEHGPGMVNWKDLTAYDISLHADEFRMSHGRFYAVVNSLQAKEKSGWAIRNLSGKVAAGQGDALIYDIHIEDNCSTSLDLDFQMLGRTIDFMEFKDKVTLVANIHENRVSLSTLTYFFPGIKPGNGKYAILSGGFKGKINDFSLNRLGAHIEGTGINVCLDGMVKNITDKNHANVNVSIRDISFTGAELTRFARNTISSMSGFDITRFGSGKRFYGALSLRGSLNNLACNASLRQGRVYGSASLKGRVRNLVSSAPVEMEGEISTSSLDLGTLLQKELLGPASVDVNFKVKPASKNSELKAEIENFEIEHLEFNNYAYHDINGNASIAGKEVSVVLHSNDRNCDADIAIWTDEESYHSSLNVHNADLKKLNIDKRQRSEIAFNAYVDLTRDLDNMKGKGEVSDITLTSSDGTQTIGTIGIDASSCEGRYDIHALSKEFEATFLGNLHDMDAQFTAFNTTAILAYLMPGAYIDRGTTVSFKMGENGSIDGSIVSHRIAWKENYIKDFSIRANGSTRDFKAIFQADEIKAMGFALNNNILSLDYADATANASYSFHNDSEKETRGELALEAYIQSRKNIEVNIRPTSWFLEGSHWRISPSCIKVDNKDISINTFSISNGDQVIGMDGTLSKDKDHSFTASIRNFDMSSINAVIKRAELDIAGKLNASAVIKSPLSKDVPDIKLNIDAKDLNVGGTDLGRFTAAYDYNPNLRHFYLSANQRIADKDILQANALMNPDTKRMEANISLDRYPVDFAQRFIPTVLRDFKGKISGQFMLNGPLDHINISSRNARIDDGLAQVFLTHVKYDFSGTMHCDNSGIHLDKVMASDRFGTTAPMKGGVSWNRGKNMRLGFGVDFKDIEFVNIPSGLRDQLFWGQMITSGDIFFDGPFNDITMSLNINDNGDSEMHLVTARSANAHNGELLTFIDPNNIVIDPYEQMLNMLMEKRRRMTDFKVKAQIRVNPGLKVIMDLGNNRFSSGVRGMGNGLFDVSYNKSDKNYSIFGDYSLTEGRVDVNVSNLVHRVFQIQNGSMIRFSGKIPDTSIDVNAYYETKATLNALLAESESDGRRRQVQCGINISNNIKNPNIKFSINIPDLNPSIRSTVEAALSTEDKINKQFLSLLLSNNFLPDEQGGIINNSSMLFSNVSEIMANQVNNIFNKLNIPLDLGLNYRPSEQGTNLFDVAISTQLFNNRVIIGGNFGNRQNMASGAGTFFGDVDVQYKVIRSGAFRIKAFSHSADKYSNFLDNGQRNGLGISWQQEFDSFPEWFKALFSSKARKEALKQMDALNMKPEKTIILDE